MINGGSTVDPNFSFAGTEVTVMKVSHHSALIAPRRSIDDEAELVINLVHYCLRWLGNT